MGSLVRCVGDGCLPCGAGQDLVGPVQVTVLSGQDERVLGHLRVGAGWDDYQEDRLQAGAINQLYRGFVLGDVTVKPHPVP